MRFNWLWAETLDEREAKNRSPLRRTSPAARRARSDDHHPKHTPDERNHHHV